MPPEFLFYALIMDIVFGEPAGLPHPVQAVGAAVTRLDRALRKAASGASAEKAAGALMAAVIASAAFFLTYAVISISYTWLGHWAGSVVSIYLAYTTISARGLAKAASAVARPLEDGDIQAARGALSMIVGRDTLELSTSEVARGAVETVAENTSDGVVAPLFFLAVGGVPLAMAYKAVNTMDSMVGYKDERNRYFGWAAARLDDAANFIPSRLSGVFIVVASALLGLVYGGKYSAGPAWRIFVRDRRNHPSPNSGQPEAAMAGALGVRLGGESSYSGVASLKPPIGEPLRKLGPDAVNDASRLMYAAGVLAAAAFVLVSYCIRTAA